MSGIRPSFRVKRVHSQVAIGVLVALFVIGVLSRAGGSEDAPDDAAPAPRAITSRQQIRDPNCIAVHPSITRAWNDRIHEAVIAMAAA